MNNSVDVDFRVESSGNGNALFVRASDGNVGIGAPTPRAKLHVRRDYFIFTWISRLYI